MPSPIWSDVFLPFFLSRLSIFVAGQLALAWGVLLPGVWQGSNRPWIDMWARWDSGWYFSIATQGYDYVPGQASNVVFFPAYPFLVRLISLGSRDHELLIVVGWIISNTAALVAFYLLYKLILLDDTPNIARRAIWLLAFFPTSFFFSVAYTESLFLALTIGAFYVARKRRWLAAGLLGGLSALTRVIGVLLILPLAWEWYRQKPRRWAGALSLLLIPLGLGLYMFYLGRSFGNPLLFSSGQSAWSRSASPSTIADSLNNLIANPASFLRGQGVTTFEVTFLLLALVLLIIVFWRQRLSYAIFATYAVILALASFRTTSIPRFFIVAFPLFIAMAQILYRPLLFRLVLIAMAILQAILAARWALGYWLA